MLFAGRSLHNEMTLLVLGVIGAATYGIAIWVLFRRQLREMMSRAQQDPGSKRGGNLQSD
jgi:hypothetical protein